MRKHNGMRPQDIAILLKVIALDGQNWQLKDLSHSLFISISEVSESMARSKQAGLLDYNKKEVNRQNLLEFLQYGFRYVFPQTPGTMVRGIPTGHSHPFMKLKFTSEMKYVWPEPGGEELGLLIEPLYPKQARAAMQDELFYKLLALVDVIRVGRLREIKYAVNELEKMIVHEPSYKYCKN